MRKNIARKIIAMPAILLFLAGTCISCICLITTVCGKTTHHNFPKVNTRQNGYKLVWADEFNIDGAVNTNNWTFETGFVRNHEFFKATFLRIVYFILLLLVPGQSPLPVLQD